MRPDSIRGRATGMMRSSHFGAKLPRKRATPDAAALELARDAIRTEHVHLACPDEMRAARAQQAVYRLRPPGVPLHLHHLVQRRRTRAHPLDRTLSGRRIAM